MEKDKLQRNPLRFVFPFHRRMRRRHTDGSSSSSTMYLGACFIFITLMLSVVVAGEPSPKPIMSFPTESSTDSGTYSLFPHEDLRTGKTLLRFEDERLLDRSRPGAGGGSGGHRFRSSSYPIMFEDRLHRPGDYNNRFDTRRDRDRSYLDSFSNNNNRGSRVYFEDDRYRGGFLPPPTSNNYYRDPLGLHRDRPLSPLGGGGQGGSYQNGRPYHHHYLPDRPPIPGPSHSKLPVGASRGNVNIQDSDYRIHVFDPASNSFGNPRHSTTFRDREPQGNPVPVIGNFVENSGPTSDLFLNHDQYLEYHRKIAIVREQEFRKLQQALGQVSRGENKGSQQDLDYNNKKLLFSSKHPLEISGLQPPPPPPLDENNGSPIVQHQQEQNDGGNGHTSSKGQVAVFTGSDGEVSLVGVHVANNDNQGNKVTTTTTTTINDNNNRETNDNDNNGENNEGVHPSANNDGEIAEGGGGRGGNVQIESENSKYQVTQIPPQRTNFISKSGRHLAYQQIQIQPTSTKASLKASSTSSPQPQVVGSLSQHNGNVIILRNSQAKKISKPPATTFQLNSRVREPLIAEGDDDDDEAGGEKKKNDAENDESGPAGAGADGKGHALPLIEIPNEADGFILTPIVHAPRDEKFKQFPDAEGSNKAAYKSKGKNSEKSSELRTEGAKSRVKFHTGEKVPIIKQQELKQIGKEKSSSAVKAAISKNNKNGKKFMEKLYKNQNVIRKDLDLNSNTQSDSADPLRVPSGQNDQQNHPIVTNPLDTENFKSSKSSKNSKKSKNNAQDYSFLEHNDIIVPEKHPTDQRDGVFTLINQHNDQVDIVDDDNDNNKDGKIKSQSSSSIPEQKNEIETLPKTLPLTSLPYPDFDLDHSDSLLFLGSNDAVVNKAFTNNPNQIHPSDNNNIAFNKKSLASHYNPPPPANFIKVVRLRNPKSLTYTSMSASTTTSGEVTTNPVNESIDAHLPTEQKTLSMFMARRVPTETTTSTSMTTTTKTTDVKYPRVVFSSSINSSALAMLKAKHGTNTRVIKKLKKLDKLSVVKSSNQPIPTILAVRADIVKKLRSNDTSSSSDDGPGPDPHPTPSKPKQIMTMSSSAKKGVIAKVHAHVSHCPKLKAPAEIICDIHIRESHNHPNPQLTVGWRRKFYNATQPDILIVSNKTQVYDESPDDDDDDANGSKKGPVILRYDDGGSESAKNGESLEDFHDKFNVTLAPGISPMLRSVLLIRSIMAPDCGNYQCEVTDGIYTLSSETLLFLCH